MTNEQFQTQLLRLQNTFGKASFSTDRIGLLWTEVKDMPEDWFRRVADKFIGSSRQSPMLPEFREEISRYRQWQHEQQKRQPPKEINENDRLKCSDCYGLGYFCCMNRPNKSIYVFKCRCDYGKRDQRNFPHFTAAHLADFYWMSPEALNKYRQAQTSEMIQ